MNTSGEFLEVYGDYLLLPGKSQRKSEEVATGLLENYQQSWRKHHTISHLADMALFLHENEKRLRRPDELFISVIGHDSIYIPQLEDPKFPRGLNEGYSSLLTADQYWKHINSHALQRVDLDIRSTVNHVQNSDRDQAYFLDADMSILGSEPEKFDDYDENIRGEFNTIEPSVFNAGRLAVLRSFLDQGSLFITPEAQEQFGDQAIENLERKIEEYEQLVAA